LRGKPRLLIVSAVHPFPRNAGQQQRVFYTLLALRGQFHLTFLTIAEAGQVDGIRQQLLETCDGAIVLPSLYTRTAFSRLFHKLLGTGYAALTGLKFSNYQFGELEFSPQRLAAALGGAAFDGVLFEYWHAFKTARWFRQHGVAAILDMHDVLWQSFARQLDAPKFLPGWLKGWLAKRYQAREEAAWQDFDVLIAINRAEFDYTRGRVGAGAKLFHVPMGTDLAAWPHCWEPASPRRVAYYGSLGSAHNQQDALLCYREVMPLIWAQHPEVEFWIVGSNPPAMIRALARGPRVRVTGFVEAPQDILKTMSLALCPWSGTYGFRSRIVEVMALGVPVIASPDAVHGMEFEENAGIALGSTPASLGAIALLWLSDEAVLREQGCLARQQIESRFSYEATYGRFSADLAGIFTGRVT